MAKGLHNWTYRVATDFLEKKGFQFFDEVEGVGQAWINFQENGEPDRIVEIKYTPTTYAPRVMRKMMRQSGIAEAEWVKWAGVE